MKERIQQQAWHTQKLKSARGRCWLAVRYNNEHFIKVKLSSRKFSEYNVLIDKKIKLKKLITF
jgi:hypothetical protein